MRTKKFSLALMTAPELSVARLLADSALDARLAACVTLVPRVQSHYWWRGKLETSREVLMIFKTATRCLARLEAHLLSRHPYDTPEFVVCAIDAGSRRYLEWMASSVRSWPAGPLRRDRVMGKSSRKTR